MEPARRAMPDELPGHRVRREGGCTIGSGLTPSPKRGARMSAALSATAIIVPTGCPVTIVGMSNASTMGHVLRAPEYEGPGIDASRAVRKTRRFKRCEACSN